MQVSNLNKFLNAIKQAGIEKYELITDTAPTHFHNNDTSFNVYDMDEEIAYNFTKVTGRSPVYEELIQVTGADFGDIHEVRFGATIEEAKKFADYYGMNLTEEQLKILVNINGANYRLMPETGDYTFIAKSEKEIESMTDEEKAKYEAEKAEWLKRTAQQTPVRVTI